MDILNDLLGDDDVELALTLHMQAEQHRLDSELGIQCQKGSRPGKRRNVDPKRDFYAGLLFHDFWGPSPVYSNLMFRANFKIPIDLFDKIIVDVTQHEDYFRQKRNANGLLGATSHQKVSAAMRIFTSGVAAQELDDKRVFQVE